ncbi:MAG: carbon starvation protein A [Deltaproteobacteria bacterium]|nr:carbon starvation protein A [Deltaproteobacteria bacterium]MBW2309375.1 carbon starvation protein A [Deltaproteobacteria bacterium]
MNTTLLIIIGLVIYFVMYFLYGKRLQRNVAKADASRETPAVRLRDDVDYMPANRYILFGHHFASIAGAAPIIGPAIAIVWGWLPAILWVWLGNIFIGAVHDYLSLMSSVRYDGRSVQWIAGRIIEKRSGKVFAWFVFFMLILVVAAFAAVLGGIFTRQPAVPTAYILKICAALILGQLLYKMKLDLKIATIIGVAMLILAIYLGTLFPLALSYKTWMVVFFFYIIIAASIPVWVLLQPRDYLNAWLLVGGLVIGGVSLLVAFKGFSLPAFTAFSPPAIAGKPTPFWPIIPLIIACGSLSGFHSLVASGTSSKQLSSEMDGLFVGYGSMFTEGFLSTVVIASIAAFGFAALGEGAKGLTESAATFAAGYGKSIGKIGGPVGIFSKSYGIGAHEALGLPITFMTIFAGMWVASFAMTTLDTTNRLARYCLSEIAEPWKESFPAGYNALSNRWIASVIPAFIGIGLAWTGQWKMIWPAFGGANQILASVALITMAVWVSKVIKSSAGYRLLVSIPAVALWFTVAAAMVWYLFVAVPVFMAKNPVQAVVLGIIVAFMMILNVVIFWDYVKVSKKVEIEATS